MRVLHLFSNHKFTGPADPALVLASALDRAGVEVTVAAGRAPRGADGPTSVASLARGRGLKVLDELRLPRHGKILPTVVDVARLGTLLDAGAFDILHCHLPNDHLIAVLAARQRGVPVVRSYYELDPPRGLRARLAMSGTAAALVPATAAAALLERAHSERPGIIEVVEPILDLERFSRTRDEERRQGWGARPGDLLIGVVARMQTHRLFPELIEGFALAARRDRGLRLVVLGRGTNRERVAHEPARRSGVAEQIIFPGYIDPAEYPAALPCFDALIFLVPGSDGTCRAAREGLACGVPVIASRRGLLPWIVRDGETGILLPEESPAAIATAIERLREDLEFRDALAACARENARARFAAEGVAGRVRETYARVGRRSR